MIIQLFIIKVLKLSWERIRKHSCTLEGNPNLTPNISSVYTFLQVSLNTRETQITQTNTPTDSHEMQIKRHSVCVYDLNHRNVSEVHKHTDEVHHQDLLVFS